eukprot:Blabericola_migrator_1__10089@NODE_55_length_16001_cov_154_094327_g51_i0_p5_GENE_NODE_55_length_16001_cov_154_094327_g51_i0NODE_55_length_16001_cov_154_094327_g51_i0_p5_ORF_typecomplete_len434_score94_69PCI/PF01399_27/3_6e02PCI/PF01399_27/7_6e07MENTAL/PF10457_9/0_017HTH_10/PF04967_12/8_7e03HTH_10/PF04967_12/2_1e02HTH_10/PF04967_12/1_6HTH_10/PF04967_12/7_2e03_NODE_55_length_16001_cov_154_094327_g51_i071458446
MTVSALPIGTSYESAVQAADRLFRWFRVQQPETCDVLFNEAYQGLSKSDVVAQIKILTKLTKIAFQLLQHAKDEGQIKGQIPAEGDDVPREITKTHSEFTVEIEEILICFIILLREVSNDSKQLETYVNQIAAETTCADTRLKTLLYIFNAEDEKSAMKPRLFKVIIQYAVESSYFDVAILPVLNDAIKWVPHWNISAAGKRYILMLVGEVLTKSGKTVQGLIWSKTGLKTYDAMTQAELAKEKDVAAQQASEILLRAIKQPSEFYFDKLMAMSAVKLLEKHAKFAGLHQLGWILLKGSVSDLERALKTNSKLVADLKIDVPALMRKMRVIAVASEASKTTEDSSPGTQVLNIKNLAKVVGLSPEETEEACVSAVGAGLFNAKMDQLSGTICIDSAMKREFTVEDWKLTRLRLKAWRDQAVHMKTLLETKSVA